MAGRPEGQANQTTQQVERRRHATEFASTILLAFASVVTSWSGYQASLWSGIQATNYKCCAGGPQDILDAQSAYHNAQGPVDLDLLRAVAPRFGRDAADRLEQVLAS